MIRLFIGLNFPDSVNSQIEIMSCGIKGARWIAPENLHLTLRFIGEVDGGAFRELAEGLEEIRFPPFEIELDGLNYFKDGRQINTLWAGVKPTEPLQALKSKIDKCLGEFEVSVDRRKFQPHVTLARVKKAHPEKVQRFIGNHLPFNTPPFTVHAFHLFSSTLSEKNAYYAIEQSYPLASSERERLQKLINMD